MSECMCSMHITSHHCHLNVTQPQAAELFLSSLKRRGGGGEEEAGGSWGGGGGGGGGELGDM